MADFRISTELLTHFQCSTCSQWWSIGDAPQRSFWFCPWCGCRLDNAVPALPLPSASSTIPQP